MKKSFLRIICFLSLFILIFSAFNNIFSPKYSDGLDQMSHFYGQDKNSVDVLVLGSSHAFVNFNNATLWENYGIASYDLGGSNQPFWSSYFYLKEALKTQKPELIVLDAFAATQDFEYQDDGRIIKNTYGMKWSLNKIEDIKVSSEKDRNIEFLLDYAQYHTRYSSLQKGDFFDDFGSQDMSYYWYDENWKGQYLFSDHTSIEIADMSGVDYVTPMIEKEEIYYRRIIELAQENDIPIAIVVVPYSLNEYEESRLNAAEEIAKEYGVKFLNCNLCLEDIGLDLNYDYRDGCHMSACGTVKFSNYIGKYLKENYNITDRRGDEKYKTYDEHAEYVNQYLVDCEMINTSDVSYIADLSNNKNYRTFISVDGACTTAESSIQTYLESFGISENNVNGIWMKEGTIIVWSASLNDDELYLRDTWKDFYMSRDTILNTNRLVIDNVEYKKVANGLNIIVYDKKTNMIVKSIGLNMDDNFSIVQ